MKRVALWVCAWWMALMALGVQAQSASTLNRVESIDVAQQAGDVVVRIGLKNALSGEPPSFTVAKPARVVIDLMNTESGLPATMQSAQEGDLHGVHVVQAGNRTRVVLNLIRPVPHSVKVDGNSLLITLNGLTAQAVSKPTTRFAESTDLVQSHKVRDVVFRRGADGEARILVDLSDSNTGIDIRTQGNKLVVDFLKADLPEALNRKLDVTDFATPVTAIRTYPQGENVRLEISPKGYWEHYAYQTDEQFVIEVRQIPEDPNKLTQGKPGTYKGDKISLDFRNVPLRDLLYIFTAEPINLNIVLSESVGGNITLRLRDVPWDQALEVIMQKSGLDMRKNGSVVFIAPRDEIATKEKLQFESQQQISALEPLKTETFQINYHKAKALFDVLSDEKKTILSKRGRVIVDERSNKLIVSDVPSSLEDIRNLVKEIDVPSRQVLIEARIVEASDNFSKSLGTRMGVHDTTGKGSRLDGDGSTRLLVGGSLADTGPHSGQSSDTPAWPTDSLGVNLPAAALAGANPGVLSLMLFNSSSTRFLNLELSALEVDGKGKIISSPRVMTADQVEALIEQGVEIPYQQATSSGATSVAFRKANLALKVKPQITPDGKIVMTLDINKDSPNTKIATGAGVAIDTKHVKTEVLVDNGGTVVIGGIYTQEETQSVSRVPFFGDLPYVGFLFKNRQVVDDKTELLIFITPRIINPALSVR